MIRAERLSGAMHDLLVQRAKDSGWTGRRSKRISAEEVRSAFHTATGGRSNDEHPEETLDACVRTLCDRGLLRAMASTNREKIPLARGFHLQPIVSAIGLVTPPAPIWHRELYDLDGYWKSASPLRRARYVAVNRWLKSSVDRTPVPVRERCLDVFARFGDPECHPDAEKTLDSKTTTALFGDEDRLMRVLRTYRVPPPLLSETVFGDAGGYRTVGSGDLLLVIENSTTWWSLVSSLAQVERHRVGHVAWGLGKSFISSVRSIAARHRVSEVRYFGDLDPSGIRIPARAAAIAAREGLPPVRPAERLYGALLAHGIPAPAREKVPVEQIKPDLDWLPRGYHGPVVPILAAGLRLAQEWVGLRLLTSTTDWHDDLR